MLAQHTDQATAASAQRAGRCKPHLSGVHGGGFQQGPQGQHSKGASSQHVIELLCLQQHWAEQESSNSELQTAGVGHLCCMPHVKQSIGSEQRA